MPFEKGARLSIGSLDNPNLSVEAQYNPKELQLDRPVPWAKHNLTVEGSSAKARRENQDAAKADRGLLHLEFNGAESRTIALDLLFDEVETEATQLLQRNIAKLDEMSRVIDPFSEKEDKRRPHFCVVAYGGTLRGFRCVIESLSVKFTMFDRKGDPLRATCTVKLKEADRLTNSDKEKEQFSGDKTPARR
jgi:contractile injection system tube protein